MKVATTLSQTGKKSSVHTWDIQNPAVLVALQGAVLALSAMMANMGQKAAAGIGGTSSGARNTASFGYALTDDAGATMYEQKSTWNNLADSDVSTMRNSLAYVMRDFDASAVKTKV